MRNSELLMQTVWLRLLRGSWYEYLFAFFVDTVERGGLLSLSSLCPLPSLSCVKCLLGARVEMGQGRHGRAVLTASPLFLSPLFLRPLLLTLPYLIH